MQKRLFDMKKKFGEKCSCGKAGQPGEEVGDSVTPGRVEKAQFLLTLCPGRTVCKYRFVSGKNVFRVIE